MVGIPDAASGPRLYSKTLWIALSAPGPWKSGFYTVGCILPRGMVTGSFAMG